MRRKLVAGNWKMHGTRAGVAELLTALRDSLRGRQCDIAVCPPFVFLDQAERTLDGSAIALGAQDVAVAASGAYTGEISAGMLREFGCRYVLVGHSERRQYQGESDALVTEKFRAAQDAGLVPILCVGENLSEREAGETLNVVYRQLGAVLRACGIEAFEHAVVAYEPVWAIGTGRTATPAQAQTVHVAIRAQLAADNPRIAERTRILYGGSVKADNAAELFAETDIDGGLIGGASLQATDFAAICFAAGNSDD